MKGPSVEYNPILSGSCEINWYNHVCLIFLFLFSVFLFMNQSVAWGWQQAPELNLCVRVQRQEESWPLSLNKHTHQLRVAVEVCLLLHVVFLLAAILPLSRSLQQHTSKEQWNLNSHCHKDTII